MYIQRQNELIKLKYQSINQIEKLKDEQTEILEQIKQEKSKILRNIGLVLKLILLTYNYFIKENKKRNKNKDEIIVDQDNQNMNKQSNKTEAQESPKINVPHNLEIINLASPIRTQGHLILCGVQRHNAEDSSYFYDILFNLKPQVILINLPVDDPFLLFFYQN